MNPFVKLLIGLMFLISGVSWYLFKDAFVPYFGVTSFEALGIVFVGGFGLVLLSLGLLVTWIEIEEVQDYLKERKKKAGKKK